MNNNDGGYQPIHEAADIIAADGSNATVVVYGGDRSFVVIVGTRTIGRGWGPEGLRYFYGRYPKANFVSGDNIVYVDGCPEHDKLSEPQPPQVSNVTQQLIDQLRQRDAHGKSKYGVTLDRTDLNLGEWLQHQAEELMDGAGYALAAKREYERLRRIEEAARLYVNGSTAGGLSQLRKALLR